MAESEPDDKSFWEEHRGLIIGGAGGLFLAIGAIAAQRLSSQKPLELPPDAEEDSETPEIWPNGNS